MIEIIWIGSAVAALGTLAIVIYGVRHVGGPDREERNRLWREGGADAIWRCVEMHERRRRMTDAEQAVGAELNNLRQDTVAALETHSPSRDAALSAQMSSVVGAFASVNTHADEKGRSELLAGLFQALGAGMDMPAEQYRQAADDVVAMTEDHEHIPRETLQRFLSDLARLCWSYGVELDGTMRVKPITEYQGGYVAERVDEGPRVLSSYGSGMEWDDPTDDVVGDDWHPDAVADRRAGGRKRTPRR